MSCHACVVYAWVCVRGVRGGERYRDKDWAIDIHFIILYLQEFEEVLQGRYPCSLVDATAIAALYLQTLNGDAAQNQGLVNE